MSEPTIKKPTRKTFHFPKAAQNAVAEKTAAVEVPVETKKAVAKAPVEKKAVAKAPDQKKKAVAKAPAQKKKAVAKAPAEKKETVASAPTAQTPEESAPLKKAAKAGSGPTIRKAVEANPVVKTKRVKKDKVVRDSFTMPKSDYEIIAALKLKCQEAGVPVKKSELLRAGLKMLEAASASRLLAAVSALEQVKTGRPAKA